MKLLVEGHPYPFESIRELFPNIDELDVVDGVASVNYVGYYYYAEKSQAVFILPKVVIDHRDNLFGVEGLRPEHVINLDEPGNPLSQGQRQFIYGLSVWIYRAIAVYRDNCVRQNKDHTIIRQQSAIKVGRGKHRTGNTFLDIILSLIEFARQNKDWFLFILKNNRSGFNKINWSKTITKSQVVIQDNEPVYIDPITKKRRINFDEELLVIFYSILNYVRQTYGFPVEVDLNYNLITGKRFECYMPHRREDGTTDCGFGVRRLRQIKYKYFSDKALQLWDLCFAFFDQSKNVRINAQLNEFLLAKNFNIVFEAIIDELIGDSEFPDRLNKKQEDGKQVDHMYLYKSLTSVEPDKQVYYIGDSKYYKQKNPISKESVAKQYTYARNVIQWNLNLFFGEDSESKPRETDFCLRDEITEGYNIIPNFFISATVPDDLSYTDTVEKAQKSATTFVSQQFRNRLFDRDTLLVTHYDVNFLYVVSLYARNNAYRKKVWREKVRGIFRDKIQKELERRFKFFAMRPKPGVDAREFIETHFRDILGKVYAPYDDKDVIALALDNRKQFDEENLHVLAELGEAFTIVECPLGQDPRELLPPASAGTAAPSATAMHGKFLFGIVNKNRRCKDGHMEVSKEYLAFVNREADEFVMRNMPGGDISEAKYFVPMFDGGIAGYYEIIGITFGSRKQPLLDDDANPILDAKGKEIMVKMPCLNIKLGAYTPLGDHIAEIPKFRNWNGQIHTYSELLDLYK
ncbi:restriction endonuclease [Phocaeicola plebeius]|uniref:restriction endonuclease n=1 Tax=Phocaeicola plebeius TaxID=310297 RepID=UPI0026EB3A28|nr:restriction endonuclease [Phocaeicola plebeius]